jgi:hypothetical protein
MKAKILYAILIVTAGVAVAPAIASAQDTASAPQATTLEKSESKSAPQKVHKVWTNDDIGSVRSPTDIYTQQKEARAGQVPHEANPTSSNAKPAPSTQSAGPPPALTNPKTADEADSMIAWENRDIEAQQGTIVQLKKELEEAPLERREALQKLLQERMQVLADSRKELQALQAKKEELQTQPSAGGNTAGIKPPSQ